jgi:hypothetical protein
MFNCKRRRISFCRNPIDLIAALLVRRFGALQVQPLRGVDPSFQLSLSYFLAKGDNSRHLSKQLAR